jgi:hypothetical protein
VTTLVDQAIQIARKIRRDLLRTADNRALHGDCGLASVRLAVELGLPDSLRFGVFMKWEKYAGRRGRRPHEHAWNVVDGTIIDITATQFASLPAIYVVPVVETDRYVEQKRGMTAARGMFNWDYPHWERLRRQFYKLARQQRRTA